MKPLLLTVLAAYVVAAIHSVLAFTNKRKVLVRVELVSLGLGFALHTISLIADWVGHRLSRISSGDALDEKTLEDRPTLVATLHAFLDALGRGAPMPITGLDGQRAVEIADACYQSAATGKAVRLG